MLFGNALPPGIESHRPVLSGKIMDIVLKACEDFPLARVHCRFRFLLRVRKHWLGIIDSHHAAPLEQQAGEYVGESREDAVGGVGVGVLHDEFQGLAEAVVVVGFIGRDADEGRFLVVEKPLTQASTVRSAHFRHDIFRVDCDDYHLGIFQQFNIFQYLATENDKYSPCFQDIVLLLDSDGYAALTAKDADSERDFQWKSETRNEWLVILQWCPVLRFEVFHDAEFVFNPSLGEASFQIRPSYGIHYVFFLHIRMGYSA